MNRYVEVCLRFIAATDEESRSAAVEEAREILQGKVSGELPNRDLCSEIEKLLTEVGVPSNVRGFDDSVAAIALVVENEELKYNITTKLYPAVADQRERSVQKVERSIRHAITAAFDKGNYERMVQIFDGVISKKKGVVTNAQFIAGMAKEVRRRLEIK